MLRKLISVKNVGRFLNYTASGDVELKRYSLFFAENGRGKTTLCAILRSLQGGSPAYVVGRTTLGSAGTPEIDIRTDAGNATFSGASWNTTVPTLTIFDSTFVSENVYSGDLVELDHRRNLYRVIIGKDGVDLARQVDQLDADIRDKTSAIRDKRAAVQLHAPQGITAEVFLPLPEDPDIDAKIAAKEKELEAVKRADQIRAHSPLIPLTIPAMPEGLDILLATTIEGLAVDAERRVSAHIEAHAMHERGETWLSEGRDYVRDEACPFCGQSLKGLALIQGYSAHFSEAYHTLRREIIKSRTNIENALGERAIAQAERTIDVNDSSAEFWTRYCEITRPLLASNVVLGDALRTLRQTALSLLDRKSTAPLDPVTPDQTYTEALTVVASIHQAAATYNVEVQLANAVIAAKRVATGTTNRSTVEAALRLLQAIQARRRPAARTTCEAYESAVREKKTLEDQKAAVRIKLDEHTQKVIGRYERAINTLLDDFQAGFRITGTKHDYRGGVPSSSFQILINETPVELGDDQTALGTPSFRNTLSSGDKSTLALAFFLAELGHDADKANKIVVFDDPFNSQDAFRKDHTVAKIKKCGDTCAQVIVLSHDQAFLKRIWDRLATQPPDRKCLQMARIGLRNTTISEFDIEKATQDRFKSDLNALASYYNACEGNSRDIVNKIRPVLETYCRNLYPSEFSEVDMLGTIIGKVRHGGATHPLADIADDMVALNEYTKRYHHGENPSAATEAINDTELQGFVKKTMTITGYC
jgi:wobble nucleotide-excising tRNase